MTGFVTKKITRKRTLGSLLKSARTKAEVTLDQAEKEIKIPAKYLLALENGDYAGLPAEAYNIGFVRTYAQFLRLDPEKVVGLYREERSVHHLGLASDQVSLSPRKMGDWHFLITPKLVGAIVSVLAFVGLGSYVFIQFNKFSQPPVIDLGVPKEFTSAKDTVTLNGKTAAGSIVSMNAEPIYVATDGNFTQDVQLSPGVNEIRIVAKNRAQKESQTTVKVLYDQGVAKLPSGGTSNIE